MPAAKHVSLVAWKWELLLTIISRGDESTMSVISDWAAKEEATLQQIAAGIKALDDKIQALSSSAGALSPEDQAALDQIASESAALATTANTIPGA